MRYETKQTATLGLSLALLGAILLSGRIVTPAVSGQWVVVGSQLSVVSRQSTVTGEAAVKVGSPPAVGRPSAEAAQLTVPTASPTAPQTLPTPTSVQPAARSPQNCRLVPLGLRADLVQKAAPGTIIHDRQTGPLDGSFAWLVPAGDNGDAALAAALRLAGPPVRPGAWLAGRDPVAGDAGVRAALAVLVASHAQVAVPLWDTAVSDGETGARYHLSGYAAMTMLEYSLDAPNTVALQYLGPTACTAGY